MGGNKKEICQAVCQNLDRFCGLFTRTDFKLSWFNQATKDQTIVDPRNVELTFRINDIEQFNLSFGTLHFGFNRLNEQTIHETYDIEKYILKAEKPWHPYFAFYISHFNSILSHPFTSPAVLDSYIKGYFYSSSLDSLEGRLDALTVIGQYKQKFQSNTFDYLIPRWVEPKGKYFAEWQDKYTNLEVLNSISSWMSLEEIRALKIDPLNTLLAPENLVSTLQYTLLSYTPFSNLARLLLKPEGAIESLINQKFTYPNLDDEEDLGDLVEGNGEEGNENFNEVAENNVGNLIEEEVNNPLPLQDNLNVGDNEVNDLPETNGENIGEENVNAPFPLQPRVHPTFSLMHILAMLDLEEFMDKAVKGGANINERTTLQDTSQATTYQSTPLHYAVRDNQVKALKKLLALGADPNLKDSQGETPFDQALAWGKQEVVEVLLTAGVKLTKPETFSSNAFQLTRLNLKSFEMLIEQYPPTSFDYKDVFQYVVHNGDVEKFHFLRNKVDFATIKGWCEYGFFYSQDEKREGGAQIIKELIEMGVDLSSLSNFISSLDTKEFEKFVPDLLPQQREQAGEIVNDIANHWDLEKLRVLHKEGIKCTALRWYWTSSYIPSEEEAKKFEVVMELLSMGANLNALSDFISHLNIQYFEKFVEELSSAQQEDLIAYLATPKHLDRLQILRKKGVQFKPITCWYGDFSGEGEENLKVIMELLNMGANLEDLRFKITDLNIQHFEKFVQEFSLKRKNELVYLVQYLRDSKYLAHLRILRENGIKCESLSYPCYSLKAEEEIKIWEELFAMGLVPNLKDYFWVIADAETSLFEKFIRIFPSGHQGQLLELVNRLVSQGALEKLQILRKKGVRCESLQYQSPYVEENKLAIIIELLEMGAPLNLKNCSIHSIADSETPLFKKFIQIFPSEHKEQLAEFIWLLVSKGEMDKLQILHNKGITFVESEKDGYESLRTAFYKNRLDIMKQLITMGANINYCEKVGGGLLESTLLGQDITKLRKLVELGLDVNRKVRCSDNRLVTPLIWVGHHISFFSFFNNDNAYKEKAAILIAAGADPDEKDSPSDKSFREFVGPHNMQEIEKLVEAIKKSETSH